MFDHVTLRVADLERSKRFCDLAFEALEFPGGTVRGRARANNVEAVFHGRH